MVVIRGKRVTVWTLTNHLPSSRSTWNFESSGFYGEGKTPEAWREPTTNSTHVKQRVRKSWKREVKQDIEAAEESSPSNAGEAIKTCSINMLLSC